MKITKFAHSCLLVEATDIEGQAGLGRTALFDPGEFSVELVRAGTTQLQRLDDIVITHEHYDHFNLPLVKELVTRFPQVRILAPGPVVSQLADAGVMASTEPPEGMQLFKAPHESVAPLGEPPEEIGIHFLDIFSDPGDCHQFSETKAILALPVTAPWGATSRAARLATDLKPRYIVPVHDWMWKDEWRRGMYARLAQYFAGQGITFIQAEDGVPFTIDIG